MNETRFTPGPWSIKPLKGGIFGIHSPRGAVSYTMTCYTPEKLALQFANANLIAAAPRLYQKLDLAATIFEEYARLHRAKGTAEGDQKALRNDQYAAEMRAELARARGEP